MHVELDQSKRLLVISAVERVTAAEAKLAAQRVRELLRRMLCPVSAFWRISDGWTQWIRRRRVSIAEIMDALTERGVGSVTRVITPTRTRTLVSIFYQQFHYGPEVRIATFGTLADALQSLAGDG